MKKSKIQVFITNLVLTCLSLLKMILLSNWGIKKLKKKPNLSDCIVLGNGPSLKDTLAQHLELIQKKDSVGVNFFWKSDYYTIVKPKYYMIVSTNYWATNKIDQNSEGRLQTFDAIAEQTDWDMTLYVPAVAKKHRSWRKKLDLNPHISIVYFNITPVDGFFTFVNWALKRNLGLPRPHNVLVPAIKTAIDVGYKKIYVVGADHSWLKDIFVAEDNQVYLTHEHFYDKKPLQEVMYEGTTNETRNLANVLMKFVYSFQSYYVLEQYAQKQASKVYNATPVSFIDAFERQPLKNN